MWTRPATPTSTSPARPAARTTSSSGEIQGRSMAFDTKALTAKIRELGEDLTPGLLEGSGPIFAPFHEREPYADITLARRHRYGGHERHRLDVFQPKGASGLPVFVC